MDQISAALYYVAFKPNPLVQIFYLLIAVGGYYIYVTTAYIKYCPGPYLAGYHRWIAGAIMFACYYSFYKACTVDPGRIEDQV